MKSLLARAEVLFSVVSVRSVVNFFNWAFSNEVWHTPEIMLDK